MYCILKDRRTFQSLTDTTCSVTNYELITESIYDEISDIRVTAAKVKPKEGDIVFLENGFAGIVQEAEGNVHALDLRCRQMVTIFDRDIFYSEPQGAYIEERLENMIDVNFTNQPDALYRLPYLEVIVETRTASSMRPDIDDDGLYNIKSYIAKLRRLLNIFVTFEFKRSRLIVRIARKIVPTKQIDFSDADLRIIERSFSCERIGKITSWAEDTNEKKDWYLKTDGTVTSIYSEEGRVDGEWQPIKVREAVDVADAVADKFKNNSFSHKITFTAPPEKARFDFYDSIKIAIDDRLFDSYIAAVKISKDSTLTEYQCGELRTTYPLKELI